MYDHPRQLRVVRDDHAQRSVGFDHVDPFDVDHREAHDSLSFGASPGRRRPRDADPVTLQEKERLPTMPAGDLLICAAAVHTMAPSRRPRRAIALADESPSPVP
jgi:hypothetical protein